jgi:hypothetical protein
MCSSCSRNRELICSSSSARGSYTQAASDSDEVMRAEMTPSTNDIIHFFAPHTAQYRERFSKLYNAIKMTQTDLTRSRQFLRSSPSVVHKSKVEFPSASDLRRPGVRDSDFTRFPIHPLNRLHDFDLVLHFPLSAEGAPQPPSSFFKRPSITSLARRFGVNGTVTIVRGVASGVNMSNERHTGQSTDSCQEPQLRCSREKNHFSVHKAQKVCPHSAGVRV